MKRIGSLWSNVSKKDGRKYLSGSVEVVLGLPLRIAVFPSKEKKSKNSPDYVVVVLDDKKEPAVEREAKVTNEDFL